MICEVNSKQLNKFYNLSSSTILKKIKIERNQRFIGGLDLVCKSYEIFFWREIIREPTSTYNDYLDIYSHPFLIF